MAVDTLKWKDALVDGGIEETQARAIVTGFADHVMPELVTKTDIEQALERMVHTMTVRFVTFGAAIAGLGIAITKLF